MKTITRNFYSTKVYHLHLFLSNNIVELYSLTFKLNHFNIFKIRSFIIMGVYIPFWNFIHFLIEQNRIKRNHNFVQKICYLNV